MLEFVNFYLIPGLILGSIYALGAIGVSMLFGILRFAHFAHGDLMTLGAYFALTIVHQLGWPPLAAMPALNRPVKPHWMLRPSASTA